MSSSENLEARVIRVAEAALKEQSYVAPLDVLVGLRWLSQPRVDEWRQGRLPAMERGIETNLSKVSTAMKLFRQWARANDLVPSETAYVARTRDRRPLQFSASGDPVIEQAYRTHWVSPALSQAKRSRLAEKQSRLPDLVVISPLNEDWTCIDCSGSGDLLMMEDAGPVCMACADMDHLVFLGAGDAALTRRAKAASSLSAVVVRFNRARNRYQRQGVMVEESALEQAETQCLADAEARHCRHERDAARRAIEDVEFQARFADALCDLLPGCPSGRAQAIAAHAAVRGSGRVGRSAAGRVLDPEAVMRRSSRLFATRIRATTRC